MNVFLAWLPAVWLVLAVLPARATPFNGQNYVGLADWGRANSLVATTARRGDELMLSNANTQLVFDVDDRTVEINGISVALSFPPANIKGVMMVSQLDLDTAIRPLVSGRVPASRKITTICLDPGHGGKDTGNRVGWHYEKIFTLALAFELKDQLQKAGFSVFLTRNRDTYVELPERPDLANGKGADLFISLHFNATETGKGEVAGPETYCITPVGASSTNARGEGADYGPTTANRNQNRSLLLAYQVQKSLVRGLDAHDRSVRRARFAVLRDAQMPAILIEGGYMTNPSEGQKIYSAAYRKQMAAAIVRGILAYQKLPVGGSLAETDRHTAPKVKTP